MFDELDNNLKQLMIDSYGISITTMEEVFLRVASLEREDLAKLNNITKKPSLKLGQEKQGEIDDFDLNAVRTPPGMRLFFIHFVALFLKRVRFFKRDLRGLICEVFLPMAVVLVGLSILLINFILESPVVLLTPALL